MRRFYDNVVFVCFVHVSGLKKRSGLHVQNGFQSVLEMTRLSIFSIVVFFKRIENIKAEQIQRFLCRSRQKTQQTVNISSEYREIAITENYFLEYCSLHNNRLGDILQKSGIIQSRFANSFLMTPGPQFIMIILNNDNFIRVFQRLQLTSRIKHSEIFTRFEYSGDFNTIKDRAYIIH